MVQIENTGYLVPFYTSHTQNGCHTNPLTSCFLMVFLFFSRDLQLITIFLTSNPITYSLSTWVSVDIILLSFYWFFKPFRFIPSGSNSSPLLGMHVFFHTFRSICEINLCNKNFSILKFTWQPGGQSDMVWCYSLFIWMYLHQLS